MWRWHRGGIRSHSPIRKSEWRGHSWSRQHGCCRTRCMKCRTSCSFLSWDYVNPLRFRYNSAGMENIKLTELSTLISMIPSLSHLCPAIQFFLIFLTQQVKHTPAGPRAFALHILSPWVFMSLTPSHLPGFCIKFTSSGHILWSLYIK